VKEFFLSRLTWGITISFFFYSYYWYFCLTWLASYLVLAHGLSNGKMGTFVALSLLGMALASTGGGLIADRLISRFQRALFIRKMFIGGGMVLASTILLLLPRESSKWLLPTLSASLMGLGLAAGNYWAVTQLISPTRWIGRVSGYQNMVGQFAGICAPILTGYLIRDSKRFEGPILLAGISSLIAAISVIIFIRDNKGRPGRT